MPTFQVHVPELHWAYYTVEAESAADIKYMDRSDILDNDDIGFEFGKVFDPSEVNWEILDEYGLNVVERIKS